MPSKPTTGLEDGEFVAHHAVELLLKRVFLSNLCGVSFIKKNVKFIDILPDIPLLLLSEAQLNQFYIRIFPEDRPCVRA